MPAAGPAATELFSFFLMANFYEVPGLLHAHSTSLSDHFVVIVAGGNIARLLFPADDAKVVLGGHTRGYFWVREFPSKGGKKCEKLPQAPWKKDSDGKA